MDLWWHTSEEFRLLRDSMRDLALSSGELTSVARQAAEGDLDGLMSYWRRGADAGYWSIAAQAEEAEDGGLAVLSPILEEAGRALVPAPVVDTACVALPLIDRALKGGATLDLEEAVSLGRVPIALAGLDVGGEVDLSSIRLAAKAGPEGYIIDGSAGMVAHPEIADLLLVVAREAADSQKSVVVGVMDRKSDGIEFGADLAFDAGAARSVRFHRATLPVSRVLLRSRDGGPLVQDIASRVKLGATGLISGMLAQVVDMAVAYARTREQFGYPIGTYQAVKHRIVDSHVAWEQLRSWLLYAAHAFDQGLDDAHRSITAAMTFGSDALRQGARANVQLHGAMGFTAEMDCHLYVKRAWSIERWAGSPRPAEERLGAGLLGASAGISWRRGEEQTWR